MPSYIQNSSWFSRLIAFSSLQKRFEHSISCARSTQDFNLSLSCTCAHPAPARACAPTLSVILSLSVFSARDVKKAMLGYSPIICKISVRLLLCTSISKNTICCQVPRVNSPLTTGIVRLGPMREARTWECPLPSCHLFSCSYN